jgi:hypothetical protein
VDGVRLKKGMGDGGGVRGGGGTHTGGAATCPHNLTTIPDHTFNTFRAIFRKLDENISHSPLQGLEKSLKGGYNLWLFYNTLPLKIEREFSKK